MRNSLGIGVVTARASSGQKESTLLLPAGASPRRTRTRQQRIGEAMDYSALSLPGAALMLIGPRAGGVKGNENTTSVAIWHSLNAKSCKIGI